MRILQRYGRLRVSALRARIPVRPERVHVQPLTQEEHAEQRLTPLDVARRIFLVTDTTLQGEAVGANRGGCNALCGGNRHTC